MKIFLGIFPFELSLTYNVFVVNYKDKNNFSLSKKLCLLVSITLPGSFQFSEHSLNNLFCTKVDFENY